MEPRAQTERANLEAQLDALWKEVCLLAFRGVCALTKMPADDVHHVIHKTNHTCRWDILNGVPCTRQKHESIHDDERLFLFWLKNHLPHHYKYYEDSKNTKPRPIPISELQARRKELNKLKHKLRSKPCRMPE